MPGRPSAGRGCGCRSRSDSARWVGGIAAPRPSTRDRWAWAMLGARVVARRARADVAVQRGARGHRPLHRAAISRAADAAARDPGGGRVHRARALAARAGALLATPGCAPIVPRRFWLSRVRGRLAVVTSSAFTPMRSEAHAHNMLRALPHDAVGGDRFGRCVRGDRGAICNMRSASDKTSRSSRGG